MVPFGAHLGGGERKERNQEKGNPLPTTLRDGFCQHLLVSYHLGQTRSMEAAIPPWKRLQPSLEGAGSISPGSFQHSLQ